MGLLTALTAGSSALNAAQTAIQVAGQNIANATDPNYTRQRVSMAPFHPVETGGLFIGGGVEVARIERIVNQQLDDLLRDSGSDLGALDVKHDVLRRLEGIFNELDGAGLSSALSRFFDSAENLATQPHDMTARRLFVSAAESLAETFRVQDRQILQIRNDLNAQLEDSVATINQLSSTVAELNEKILIAEKGGAGGNANDLRTRRDAALNKLGEFVNIHVQETSTGMVNVSVGSEFIVENTVASPLTLDPRTDGDLVVSDIRIDGNKLLRPQSGRLQGILEARDTIVPEIRSQLSALGQGVIREVNRVHVAGQGLVGYSDLTSVEAVTSAAQALNDAGLNFTPKTGSFDIKIENTATGLVKTYNIGVDLDGLNSDDTTLQTLVNSINSALSADFPEIQAAVNFDNRLHIFSANSNLTFSFANDTSEVLSSLGVGSLFAGSGARDMEVSSVIASDVRLVATGWGDGPGDPRNIQAISDLRNTQVLQNNTTTIEDSYQGLVGALGVETAQARELLFNQEAINEHLANERAAISGVNLDEETADLIGYQRMFQGSARYISVVDTVLETLVNLI